MIGGAKRIDNLIVKRLMRRELLFSHCEVSITIELDLGRSETKLERIGNHVVPESVSFLWPASLYCRRTS